MMDQELISKKDLLDAMGISYGQLYRWKRKQLIPEEWFIRKSTFTGQETFFPKRLILARIDKIVNMKDDLSLDELADKLSDTSVFPDLPLSIESLRERNIVSSSVLDRYHKSDRPDSVYSFSEALCLFAVDRLLSTGEMSLEEGDLLHETLKEQLPQLAGKPCDVLFFRKMGVSSFAIVTVPADIIFDARVKVAARLSVTELAEQLKDKWL
ncbi:YhbD family protein [Cohnella faecalis]|uniref:YhbD family protein n=1 Tax=Cohnella faecalis TaxID=2315694 RepID=UPI003609E4CB